MKVNLRDKDGKFCTLQQFCADNPSATVKLHGITEAGKFLEKNRAELLKIKQLAEVIKTFDLKRGYYCYQNNSICESQCTITIDGATGTWSGTYKGAVGQSDIENYPNFAEEIFKKGQQLAEKWQATGYETAS